jgi:RHS repeat-associated protein
MPNGITMSYSYDPASELIGLNYANGATKLGTMSYAYDSLGRRVAVGGSFAQTNLPNPVGTTAYNANNQLTTWGTANLFYDANGNMTSDGTHSYTWDSRNRLTQIDNGSTASFGYDLAGRRNSKSILGTTTSFAYDGANIVQETIGGTNTANSLTGGIDEVFQRTDSSGGRSFLTDGLGSTLALADGTGTVQTSYTFDPFGNTAPTGAASTNSFAYTGRELDATGLYFYRARYYSPSLDRFVAEDPLGLSGGDVNMYGYALQSPTNYVDPFGLICTTRYIFVSCDFESFELWTMRRAEEAHEQQHVKDNLLDPYNLYRSCEEKERRGFEAEVNFLKSTITKLEGRKSLPRYSQLDLDQARQMLREDEDRFKHPEYFKDYCIVSKPVN